MSKRPGGSRGGRRPPPRGGKRRQHTKPKHRLPEPRAGESKRRFAVGVLEGNGRFKTVSSFFERGWRITVPRVSGADDGALVLAELVGAGRTQGRVVKTLGDARVARDVIDALLIDRSLDREFPASVELEAERVANKPEDGGLPREDLRELTTFTIDPTSARDFDDAISAESLGGGRSRVWIHIADVSAYVRPGSLLDQEAERRATSVYVPGAVVPMLPHSLSSGACSLVPDEDRLAVTVELLFDGAEVVESSFYRSLIRSDVRLEYSDVDEIFSGMQDGAEPWSKPLEVARDLAAKLRDRRTERGTLEVESSEPEFEFADEGNVGSVEQSLQTESHELIEHLMISANSAVAKLLRERELPALFRVHDQPDPQRIVRLCEQLESLDVPSPALPETLSPQQAGELSHEASRMVASYVRASGRGREAFTSLVLRSQAQARYVAKPRGHAGLGLADYCHFTSPIRRYPDLICHRALLSAVSGGEEEPDAHGIGDLGEWCSDRERDAMIVERDADKVALCFMLQHELRSQLRDPFVEGEVIGVIAVGAFIRFDGYEGFLPRRRLNGRDWDLNEAETVLARASGSGALRLGDKINVEVERIDAPRGRIDLAPVGQIAAE